MDIRRVINGEVNRISLVEKPANGEAICSDVFCSISGNYITTVVLKADQVIYREPKNGNEDYFFFIEEPVLEDMAHKFLESNMNNNLSTDHSPFLEPGIKLAESWVEDGVWRVKLRVDNEELMGRIHEGSITGASVESINIMETVLELTDDEDKFIADARALDDKTKNILFGDFIY